MPMPRTQFAKRSFFCIINTDNRVTDHRLKMNFELTSFLDGDIETAVQSCAAMEQRELLEELAESVGAATG
ncbi:hypothetical protein Sjap_019995 [Stephania japonica]|uniref:Uncharacterized protein n=1 Tax=Stephania japonica TaxID=461633 RepID=A0AAP0EZV8_9MAGN